MRWSQNTLFLGFLSIVIGIILLSLSSADLGTSTFFIFPFFFFSVSDSLGFLVLVTVGVILMILMVRSASIFSTQVNRAWKEQYIKVGSICKYCGNPIPSNASFCSTCGNPVNHETNSNQ